MLPEFVDKEVELDNGNKYDILDLHNKLVEKRKFLKLRERLKVKIEAEEPAK